MPLASNVAGTAMPEPASTSSIAPGASATVRGSSGSENTSRIVEVSYIGRNACGAPGGPPLTAMTAGGAARVRVARVVNWNSGSAAGRLVDAGSNAGRMYTA